MGKLTDTALRHCKATGSAQKLSDGQGLYLYVSPSGGKAWRVDYTGFDGKRKTFTIGKYPEISLASARKRNLEIREQFAQGIDPGAHKKAAKAALRAVSENTFEIVALEWFNERKRGKGNTKTARPWSDSHATRIFARLTNDVFPHIAQLDVNIITGAEIRSLLARIEARGALETAHRVLDICTQIFTHAIATGRTKYNPTIGLRTKLEPVRVKHFATITDPKEIGFLLQNISAYKGNLIVRIALQIAPYVFVRPSELRCAQWNEFSIELKEWHIPAERMKMKRKHIVPLSTQVITLLEELYAFTGYTEFLFPSMKTTTRPISDMTLLSGLRRMGYDGSEMTIHGFRSMASTLLNEQGYNRDWIERQLAHSESNSVRAAYNYAQHLAERKVMMQQWADYLDKLKAKIS